jgi:hypothetical protein
MQWFPVDEFGHWCLQVHFEGCAQAEEGQRENIAAMLLRSAHVGSFEWPMHPLHKTISLPGLLGSDGRPVRGRWLRISCSQLTGVSSHKCDGWVMVQNSACIKSSVVTARAPTVVLLGDEV